MADLIEAGVHDAPVILELTRLMHQDTLVKEWFDFDARSALNTIIERINNPDAVVLFDGDGFLMGILAHPPFDDSHIFAQELGWYHTNKGGARLMSAFEAWAKQNGAQTIAMGALEGSNRPIGVLNRYYGKMGYTPFEHAYAKRL